jgi:putative membrane protein
MHVGKLLGFVLFVISILLTARWTKGIRIKSTTGAVIFALVLSVLNFFLFGPLMIVGLPLIILTFGIGIILINAVIWWLAGKLVSSVELDGYWAAIKASIITTLINWVLLKLVVVLF